MNNDGEFWATASIRKALSVHLTIGATIDYAEEDKDILTAIEFRHRLTHQFRKKSPK